MPRCAGGDNQKWVLTSDGRLQSVQTGVPFAPLCLSALQSTGLCSNIWARPLYDGSWAVTMVNNGDDNATVTCDGACFAFMNVTGASSVAVRDLWAHAVVATLQPPYTFSSEVQGQGGSSIFRFIPARA